MVSEETKAVHLSILLAILSEVTMVTVSGLQAGNFAGITINRHFRGDIFHNEGETLPLVNIIPIFEHITWYDTATFKVCPFTSRQHSKVSFNNITKPSPSLLPPMLLTRN